MEYLEHRCAGEMPVKLTLSLSSRQDTTSPEVSAVLAL